MAFQWHYKQTLKDNISENSLFRTNQYFNNIKTEKNLLFAPQNAKFKCQLNLHAQRSSKRCRAHYYMERKPRHAAEGQNQRNI